MNATSIARLVGGSDGRLGKQPSTLVDEIPGRSTPQAQARSVMMKLLGTTVGPSSGKVHSVARNRRWKRQVEHAASNLT
jgi:hypothetical protein